MPRGFEGEVLHFTVVRYRVTGSGNLKTTLKSLSDVSTDPLADLAMQAATDVEPVMLANFTNQRACLDIRTTQINESFNISKIIVFIKPVATSYPQ